MLILVGFSFSTISDYFRKNSLIFFLKKNVKCSKYLKIIKLNLIFFNITSIGNYFRLMKMMLYVGNREIKVVLNWELTVLSNSPVR